MITKSDKNFMDLCFNAAKENKSGFRARLFCCIVHKKSIISVGYNQKKSSPFQAEYARNEDSIFFHAETHAIKNFLRLADKDLLKKCTLYVSRAVSCDKRKNWSPGNSKPCSGCMSAIDKFKVGRVVYINDDGDLEEYVR